MQNTFEDNERYSVDYMKTNLKIKIKINLRMEKILRWRQCQDQNKSQDEIKMNIN